MTCVRAKKKSFTSSPMPKRERETRTGQNKCVTPTKITVYIYLSSMRSGPASAGRAIRYGAICVVYKSTECLSLQFQIGLFIRTYIIELFSVWFDDRRFSSSFPFSSRLNIGFTFQWVFVTVLNIQYRRSYYSITQFLFNLHRKILKLLCLISRHQCNDQFLQGNNIIHTIFPKRMLR